jgi:hypothetical protein
MLSRLSIAITNSLKLEGAIVVVELIRVDKIKAIE